MVKRGVIENRERAKQIRDFSKLRWGNITPTDGDCAVEFRDKLTIYVELKLINKTIPPGQKLFLERQNDDIEKSGKPCYTLIAEHNIPIDEDIDVAECIVIKYRTKKEWKKASGNKNVKQVIDYLLNLHHIKIEEIGELCQCGQPTDNGDKWCTVCRRAMIEWDNN